MDIDEIVARIFELEAEIRELRAEKAAREQRVHDKRQFENEVVRLLGYIRDKI